MEQNGGEYRANLGSTGRPRERSAIAVVEVVAGGLLVAAMFLPWFMVAYLTDPSTPSAIAPDPASSSWVNHHDYGQGFKEILIPYSALTALAGAVVGLAMPGRARVLVTIAAFAAAGLGAVLQLTEINSGGVDIIGFSATTSGLGLWLYAGAAAVGVAVGLADLRSGRSGTFVSRAFEQRPTLDLAASVIAIAAICSVGIWAATGTLAAFYLAFALLVALIFALPSIVGRWTGAAGA